MEERIAYPCGRTYEERLATRFEFGDAVTLGPAYQRRNHYAHDAFSASGDLWWVVGILDAKPPGLPYPEYQLSRYRDGAHELTMIASRLVPANNQPSDEERATDNDGIGNPFATLHARVLDDNPAVAHRVARAFIAAHSWPEVHCALRLLRDLRMLPKGDLLGGPSFADYQGTLRFGDGEECPNGEIYESVAALEELREQARGFLGID